MTHEHQTIGVVGAGQMGRGIAQVAAAHGCNVLLADLDLATAQRGRDRIATSLEKRVARGKMEAAEAQSTVERIFPKDSIEELAGASMVIEAATENESLKLEIFRNLDCCIPGDALLASNTSSISITRMAAVTQRPERVVGMHFMNPVPVMPLVEVIPAMQTAPETLAATIKMAEAWGKTVVTSKDYPGFIVNRILMPMVNEAAYVLMEGIAEPKDIDTAMTLGTNQAMGPLALADLIGLDTCLAILEVLHRDLGDPKYRPCPLLRRLVDSGRLGRKSPQGGFYPPQ